MERLTRPIAKPAAARDDCISRAWSIVMIPSLLIDEAVACAWVLRAQDNESVCTDAMGCCEPHGSSSAVLKGDPFEPQALGAVLPFDEGVGPRRGESWRPILVCHQAVQHSFVWSVDVIFTAVAGCINGFKEVLDATWKEAALRKHHTEGRLASAARKQRNNIFRRRTLRGA